MPTYEYACKGECGEHLEVHQSFHDPALTECPTCGGPLRKVFGNIGISFKGSGFYKTDSRTSKSGATNGSKAESSDGGSKTESKSDAKTESKSDGKSETKSDAPAKKPEKSSETKSAASAAS